MLNEMLKLQKDLQIRLGEDFEGMSSEDRTLFIKEHSIHLTQEIHELLYELPYFKPWKDYMGMSIEQENHQMEKAREEFIDAWHFMLNIAIALEMDGEMIANKYKIKNNINHKRQDAHYTHDKCYRDMLKEV